MLDTPVMGGPNVAINGNLVMMTAGNKESFDQCKEVFDVISNKVFHIRIVFLRGQNLQPPLGKTKYSCSIHKLCLVTS